MLLRLCLWINFIALIQVSAKTPHIISYSDVLLGSRASHQRQPSPNRQRLYKEFVQKLVFVDVLQEIVDSIHDTGTQPREEATDLFQEQVRDVVPSVECVNHTIFIISQAMAETKWAVNMLDAAAKPGSNIVGGQINWVGSYEECVNTVAYIDNTTSDPLFDGQYCTAILPVTPGPIQPATPGAATPGIRIGLCVPSTCHGDDITSLLNGLLDRVNTSLRVGETICQKKLKYDSKAIVVICILSLFLAVMAIGTVYDVIWIQMHKWKQTTKIAADDMKHQNRTVNIKDHSHSCENAPLVPKINPRTEDEEGPVGKAVLAFSVYSNTAKIFTVRQVPGTIASIHGIRFITMTWVILGHTLAFGQSVALNSVSYTERALKDWAFQVIANADVAVDTFFTISGLLVSYLILKELTKYKGRINWFMFYFHRYWRLTPVYMLVIVVYTNLFIYWGAGPIWLQDGIEPDHCRNWWTNLLYVNNLVNTKKMCMSWSWYLANDMQFYILSPLIFIPFFYSRVAGAVSSLVFLLATTITSGVLTKQREFPPSMIGGNITKIYDYFLDYYITPYCRMGPYIVGMVAGYLLHRTECKMRLPKIVVLLGWTTATAVSLAVLYGLYNNANGDSLTVNQAAFYNAVHRSAWGACISWVVVACATGNGGFINSMLSWPVIIPLSRLTYTCYLVHPVVMSVYYYGREQLFVMSTIDLTWTFFGHLIATYMIALPTSLAFEAPMMGLEKAFLGKRKSP